MKLCDLFESTLMERGEGARSFGLWLGREYQKTHGDKVAGIHLYDYNDDSNGEALRYRLLVDRTFRPYVHQIMPQINAKGWHLTAETKPSSNRWQMVFEPTTTSRVARTIFFHVTPKENVPSILSTGLIPTDSRHGFKWPQKRTYLIRDKKDAVRMIDSLSHRDPGDYDYALLSVDLRRAKGVTLHIDGELQHVAVYTTQAIAPQFIKADQYMSSIAGKPI